MHCFTGHWRNYGFGMACMYNIDYHSVGGFNTNIVGWGGEDVDLYKKHVRSPLQVPDKEGGQGTSLSWSCDK